MLNIRRLLMVCVAGLLLVVGLGWLLLHFISKRSARDLPMDWPMWRYDANRSASSPQKLPDELHLQWVREYPKLTQGWENPLNQDLMQFDKVYEPVVEGKTLFIGSSASDRMVALDTETGEEKWAFYVDGPVRLPPIASNGKVYFVSDDGYLYCVDAGQGTLIWKFRGGPSDGKILGNERIVSTWPARGGPVLKDGIIYFAAGIWPFMGIFIYALDAETGEVIWENDATGSIYMLQPHNSPSYAGVAPQGTFVVAGDKLLVPCGRSVPACFDRRTGELLYYHLARYNKTGGAFVCALGDFFINYHRDYTTSIYDLSEGHIVIPRFGKIPVMTEEALFCMGESIIAYDFCSLKQVEDERIVIDMDDEEVEITKHKGWVLREVWECDVDASGDLIKAGERLYAGGKNVVSAIALREDNKKPKASWRTYIEGTAARIIAADNKLFVVTLEGTIYAFGGEEVKPRIHLYTVEESAVGEDALARAASILGTTGIEDGYCLIYGLETGGLAEAFAQQSELCIIAVDPDQVKVDRLRRRFDAAGLYGKRISVQMGDLFSFEAPPYMASLTVFENLEAAGYREGTRGQSDKGTEGQRNAFFRKIYHSIRPYGGTACFVVVREDEIPAITQQIQESGLPEARFSILDPRYSTGKEQGAREQGDEAARIENQEKLLLLMREGPLPGATDWTHQYGDIANTVKSDDQLVKLPLGILWFGGSSNMDVLPRHGHGPPEQVVGGRLFIEGIDSFSARDVYTGRVLWKRAISDLGILDVYYDETYEDTPLDTAYNQVHIPGANARGTNFVVTLDKVYFAKRNECAILDPATGKTIDEINLPPDPETDEPPEWGYIGVYKDYLIAGAGFVHYLDFLELDELTSDTSNKRRPFYNFDITSSKKLIIVNRHTGKVLWTRDSKLGFRHNAIAVGDGKIFCIDMLPPSVSDALERRLGEYRFGTPKLMALDLRSGRIVWSTTRNVFGTWLGYSEEYDTLIQSGRNSRDMLRGEPDEGMAAYRGKNGAVLWSVDESYGGPIILHGDTIITDRYAYSLLTGEQKMRIDPLTGEERPWMFRRNYGCNYAIASEHLLTFRSAAAGFYDLEHDGGTGNFGGFKSGCTSNLIAADGVLNAPDYTRTCSCSYQNQTSLALVYMPDVEVWTTYFDEGKDSAITLSTSAVAFSDLGGSLIYVNDSLLKLLEYDDDSEVLGRSFVELWEKEERALEILETLRDEGRWVGKMVAVKEDGSTLDVHLSASMLTDETGRPISMMISFVDITDRAIAFFDLEGNVIHVNDSLLKLLEYDDDSEVLGRSFVELWEKEERALEILETLRDEGRWAGEIAAVKEDGSMLDVYLWASIVADKAGRVVSMMASFMVSFVDITDLKEAEETAADLKCVPSVVTGGTPIRAVGINLGAPGDRRADNGTLWLEYPRVGGPSPEIPVNINHEELLFSIDPGYQTDLDDESISEELRREFGNNGISLSQDATVSTEKRDTEWLITKIINKKTYIIRKEEGRLNIYHKDYERYCHHSSRIQRAAGAGSEPVPAWVVASGIWSHLELRVYLS